MKRALAIAAAAAVAATAGATQGSSGATPAATITSNVAGDDWRLPASVKPAPGTGFFHETFATGINARGLDLTWRQIEPTPGAFNRTATATAQGDDIDSYNTQIAKPQPFWMRLFASATTWAPAWLPKACKYKTVGPDYDGQHHIPIWDPCVWPKVRNAWRTLLVGQNLRNDPRLVLVYVPGAFTYTEFDYNMIDIGAGQGLTFDAYKAWHTQMVSDLIAIMNGENDDASDDQAHKLVYTGEDYPFSERFKDRVAFFARDAVAAGMGIRNGITELFNFHLGEAPAYGSRIAPDGHLVTNESWVGLDGKRIVATENECYTECGFKSKDPHYVVTYSNLKALQLRVNWLYRLPTNRYGGRNMRAHWEWVRRELGRKAADAPDAWAALRDAEDPYWRDRDEKKWKGFPCVRNLERWLVQRDVRPGGVARRGTYVKVRDPYVPDDPEVDNGRAYETLRTNRARGHSRLYLDVDENFLSAAAPRPVELKVTYRDQAGTSWRAVFRATGGQTLTTPLVRGRPRGRGAFRTVTFRLPAAAFDDGLPGSTDIVLEAVRGDVEASFVRVVKL